MQTAQITMTARRRQQSGGGFWLSRLFMVWLVGFVGLCGFVVIGAAAAEDVSGKAGDDGASLLQAFWAKTPSAMVEFRQEVFDEDGESLSDGGGILWFARGGRFRVQYQSPDELLLVSDGESFWSYEKDLRQVVVRPLSSLGGGFLAALTAGEWQKLRQLYDISAEESAADGMQKITARSRDKQDAVRRIVFIFGGGDLRHLVMHDAFGGRVRVDITSLTAGADDELFTFTPPPDAEIISDQ